MTVGSLSGGLVLTMDPDAPAFSEASVILEEGRVVDIVEGYTEHKDSIDCRGSLVMPGLVNTHAHMAEVLWRGCGGEQNTVAWIANRKHPLMAQLDPDSIRVAVRLACVEMLRSGTTAVLDPEVPADLALAVASAAQELGIRACLAVGVASGAGYGAIEETGGHGLHGHAATDSFDVLDPEFEEFIAAWRDTFDERVAMWLGLRVLSGADPLLGQALSDAMEKHRLSLTFHCAEQPSDVEAIRAESGMGTLEYAESIGILGPTTLIAHGVHLDESDLDVLCQTATSVSHCPSSNSRTGAGIAPVPAMLQRNINVGLGTDGGMVNDRYDMLSEMRYMALLQKAVSGNPKAVTPERALQIATCDGAVALGLESGVLKPGAPADVVVVDLVALGSWPTANPVDALVFSADRHAVQHVLIGGDVCLSHGEPVDVDIPELLGDAAEVSRQTIRAAGLEEEVKGSWLGSTRDSSDTGSHGHDFV